MKDGIYKDKDGRLVQVTATETGWLLRWTDGSTAEIRR
jgi:hypothetical protein